jgi:hypothetical protein
MTVVSKQEKKSKGALFQGQGKGIFLRLPCGDAEHRPKPRASQGARRRDRRCESKNVILYRHGIDGKKFESIYF